MTNEQKQRKNQLELRVVFDTNVIFTPSLTRFLNSEVSKLISESAGQTDLTFQWYVPEIVLLERQYQLISQANELLPSTKKLAKFLGQKSHIADTAIETRAAELVRQILAQSNLQVIQLDTSKIDWPKVILDSAYRRPPFDPGEKEKGFRDALIAEYFMQLLANSSDDPNLCRVVLATNDDLLTKAVHSRIKGRRNVRLLRTTEEIKGLINTLISEISEKYIEQIQRKASELFFRQGVQDSLFFKGELLSKIEQKFRDKLLELPEGADGRLDGTWSIAPPQFLKREEQRVTWVSQIILQHAAYRAVYAPRSFFSGSPSSGSLPGISSGSAPSPIFPSFTWGTAPGYSTGSVSAFSPEQIYAGSAQFYPPTGSHYTPELTPHNAFIAFGQTTFEVEWSVAATDTGELTDPEVRDIRLVQSAWF